MNPSVIDTLVQYARQSASIDSPAEFSVVIDDPAVPTYGVNYRTYIDADRAGFSDYVTKTFAQGLDQVTASEIVDLLNGDRR